MAKTPKLGIIAGNGLLPQLLIEHCQNSNTPFFVLAIQGAANRLQLKSVPHAWIRVGRVGKALKILRKNNVDKLILAGGVTRPSLYNLWPDWLGIKIITKILKHCRSSGDDTLLRFIADEIKDLGFHLMGAHELITDLQAPKGVWGKTAPDHQAMADIKRGFDVAKQLGAVDVGQSVIVQQGIVLGVEGAEGTDALIQRCQDLSRPGPKPILVKTCKPQQTKLIDLPTIGVETIKNAYDYGLSGVVVEAGDSLVLDFANVVGVADRLGIFVMGVDGFGIDDNTVF